jgi:hypothetical protein
MVGHREIVEVRIVDENESIGGDQTLQLGAAESTGIDPRGEGGRAKGHDRESKRDPFHPRESLPVAQRRAIQVSVSGCAGDQASLATRSNRGRF